MPYKGSILQLTRIAIVSSFCFQSFSNRQWDFYWIWHSTVHKLVLCPRWTLLKYFMLCVGSSGGLFTRKQTKELGTWNHFLTCVCHRHCNQSSIFLWTALGGICNRTISSIKKYPIRISGYGLSESTWIQFLKKWMDCDLSEERNGVPSGLANARGIVESCLISTPCYFWFDQMFTLLALISNTVFYWFTLAVFAELFSFLLYGLKTLTFFQDSDFLLTQFVSFVYYCV